MCSESKVTLWINPCILEKHDGSKGPKLDDVDVVFDDDEVNF
jgi:hypothetical protein